MRLPPPARNGLSVQPRYEVAVLLAALVLSPAVATADDTSPTPPPGVLELGLGQSRGVPIPVPDSAPHLRSPNDPQAASQGRIFVNFDGADLNDGYDDSTANTTQIGQLAGSFAAYGEGAKRDATMQAVRDDWEAYNVIITESRPASGNYTMCMTGPTNPFGGGVLGIAPLDCDDSQTPNNIVYAFHSVNDQFDASTQATTIGQEVAHSYGLEHVDEPGDVMNPYNAGGDPSFTDNCLTVVGGVLCGNQHAAECGSQGQQNSHRELMTLFGGSQPDTQAPTVTITAPADGSSFDEGATFELTVDAGDDMAVDQVLLYNNDEEIESDSSAPYGWTVSNAPAGTYVFYVEATDAAGNVSMSDTVTVTVGAGAADSGADSAGNDSGGDGGEGPLDSGGDSGDAGGEAGSGGDGAFDDGGDGALPPDYGLDSDEAQGCVCNVGHSDQTAAQWAWALALLGLARRRR